MDWSTCCSCNHSTAAVLTNLDPEQRASREGSRSEGHGHGIGSIGFGVGTKRDGLKYGAISVELRAFLEMVQDRFLAPEDYAVLAINPAK